ncbi:helix-turn-helix transcriptional regulator [Streptomyces sp. NPDC048172]|uniref:helix-turn-helix transcriptional regulator n=1 Tax=Streptomyces sp. NPDC048172 TaxID=3365505 RepID=UPI00371716D9
MAGQLKRHRKACGYTQEALAESMHVAVSTVGGWERGTASPQPWQCPRLCRLLDLTVGELAAMLDDAAGGDAVDRRTFLADAGALTAAAALPPPPGTAAEVHAYYRDQYAAHCRADAVLGPRRVLPAATAQAHGLEELATGASGSDRQRLWQLSAAYAGLITWLHQSAGVVDEAHHWAGRSMELSQRGRERQLAAHTVVNRAMLDTDRRDGPATIDLAATVLDDSRALAPKVRVQALQQAAHGYALSGERERVDALLDEAARLAPRIDDDYPWAVATRGPHYVEAQRATCYSRLRLGAEAGDLWDDVLSDPKLPSRDRPVFQVRHCIALADAREPERAVVVLTEALRSDAVGSPRFLAELREAWEALRPWHRSTPGRQARRLLKGAHAI